MTSSTRVGIARRALNDVLARLDDLPATREAFALRKRALAYHAALERYKSVPPSAEERVTLLQRVIDLQLELGVISRKEADTGVRRRRISEPAGRR